MKLLSDDLRATARRGNVCLRPLTFTWYNVGKYGVHFVKLSSFGQCEWGLCFSSSSKIQRRHLFPWPTSVSITDIAVEIISCHSQSSTSPRALVGMQFWDFSALLVIHSFISVNDLTRLKLGLQKEAISIPPTASWGCAVMLRQENIQKEIWLLMLLLVLVFFYFILFVFLLALRKWLLPIRLSKEVSLHWTKDWNRLLK